ncbi:MAG: hypothetical protein R6W70_01510 [bacterium]
MKIKEKNCFFVLILIFMIFMTACSELFTASVIVPYPFSAKDAVGDNYPDDGQEVETDDGIYEIDVGKALENVDETLKKQTMDAWDTLVSGLEEQQSGMNAVEEKFCSSFPETEGCKEGAPLGLTVKADENSYLTFEDLMKMLNGKVVSKSVKVEYGAEGNKTSETLSVDFSICDMNFDESYVSRNPWLTKFQIRGYKSYCLADSDERKSMKSPYFYIEYEAPPKGIMLSGNSEISKYKKYLDKIYSASASKFSLVVEEKPDSLVLEGEENSEDVSTVGFKTELYARKLNIDSMYRYDSEVGEWVECTENEIESSESSCKYVGFDEDSDENVKEQIGKIYDTVYNVDEERKRGDFWIGELMLNNKEEKLSMDLLYTYNGQQIMQKALKNLDFQLGAKSYFTINPGNSAPSGILKTTISAEFYFVVEPFK